MKFKPFAPKSSSPLDHVRISVPCPAKWEEMYAVEGNRVRYCSQCNLNVYNLSEMTREQAEAILYKNEGRLCARIYRRSDGTILTQNCPVGLRPIKQGLRWVGQLVNGMVLAAVFFLGLQNLSAVRKFIDRRIFVETGAPEMVITMGRFPLDVEPPMIEVKASDAEKAPRTRRRGKSGR
jgi:hypothetical protein